MKGIFLYVDLVRLETNIQFISAQLRLQLLQTYFTIYLQHKHNFFPFPQSTFFREKKVIHFYHNSCLDYNHLHFFSNWRAGRKIMKNALLLSQNPLIALYSLLVHKSVRNICIHKKYMTNIVMIRAPLKFFFYQNSELYTKSAGYPTNYYVYKKGTFILII